MNNQHFSVALQKENPASSGFHLKFSATEADQNASFATGIGELIVERIQYGISGVNFSGLNVLTETDTNVEIIDQVDFNITITGGPTGAEGIILNNSGALNVEKILVFTGDSETSDSFLDLSPDYADFVIEAKADENLDINFSLSEEDLSSNTGIIFYKLLPVDRISTGHASEIISGQLFTGFADLPATFTDELFISRSNLNDLRFRNKQLSLTDGATGIRIDNTGIISNFACTIELRTDQEVVITGIDTSVTFVNPPTITTATTGVTMSGNFELFSLVKDTTIENNYIVRKLSS